MVWDESLVDTFWLNKTEKMTGMLLNSRYKDKHGMHPDGVGKLMDYGDDRTEADAEVASNAVHSDKQMASITTAALKEVMLKSKTNATTGTVTVAQPRPQMVPGGLLATHAGKVKSDKSMLDDESPQLPTRGKKRLTITEVAASSKTKRGAGAQSDAAEATASKKDLAFEQDALDAFEIDVALGVDEADGDTEANGLSSQDVPAPRGLKRDTQAAFDCRRSCRRFVKRLKTIESCTQTGVTNVHKLQKRVAGRIAASRSLPKCSAAEMLTMIQLGKTGTELSGATADDIMHTDAPWMLGEHLNYFKRFLETFVQFLKTLGNSSDARQFACAWQQVCSLDPAVWTVPDEASTILATRLVDEAIDSEDDVSLALHACLTATMQIHSVTQETKLDCGILLSDDIASFRKASLNRCLAHILPTVTIGSDGSYDVDEIRTTVRKLLAPFTDGTLDLADGTNTVKALYDLCGPDLTALASEDHMTAISEITDSKSFGAAHSGISNLVTHISARSARHVAAEQADNAVAADIAFCSDTLASLPGIDHVQPEGLALHLDEIAKLASSAKHIRAKASPGFLTCKADLLNQVDSVTASVMDDLVHRFANAFIFGMLDTFAGTSDSESPNRLTRLADFECTCGKVSVQSADELGLQHFLAAQEHSQDSVTAIFADVGWRQNTVAKLTAHHRSRDLKKKKERPKF